MSTPTRLPSSAPGSLLPSRALGSLRRRALSAAAGLFLGVLSLTTLAGCPSSGDDTDGSTTGTPDQAVIVLDFATPSKDLATPPAPDLTGTPAPDAGTDPCVGDGGCFNCAPKKDDDFLNRCTSATCSRFDNARLPLLTDAGLPPLP